MPEQPRVVILGCGFTGQRVAARLLAQGLRVLAVTRDRARLRQIAALGAEVLECDLSAQTAEPPSILAPGCLVLDSLPPIGAAIDAAIVAAINGAARRTVYLSTTGVYGGALEVDERTLPAPRTAGETARLVIENALLGGPSRTLVLRPAAIYGPGRGIHLSVRNGSYRAAPDPAAFVSRIHVDDLAAHVEAALFSSLEGAYPVADEYPSPTAEVAGFCARLCQAGLPQSCSGTTVPQTRRANRRVDGRAIRGLLGLRLAYPSYREGIPACIREEELTQR